MLKNKQKIRLSSREPACNAGDLGLIPGWGRLPGEGNGCTLSWRIPQTEVSKTILTSSLLCPVVRLESLASHCLGQRTSPGLVTRGGEQTSLSDTPCLALQDGPGPRPLLPLPQFSRLVMSDSLRPHELQHARPPCPSSTPRVYPNSCPSSQ